jgi:hypothetical protein
LLKSSPPPNDHFTAGPHCHVATRSRGVGGAGGLNCPCRDYRRRC